MFGKTTKSIAAAAASVLLAGALSACGGDNAADTPSNGGAAGADQAAAKTYPENGLPVDQKVTLKVGFFEGGMGREWFDSAMDSFKRKFPNVSFEVTYSPQIAQMISTKIAAKDDDDMFDLFHSGVSGGLVPLVQAGLLEPQDDLWDYKLFDGNGQTVKEAALDGVYDSATRYVGKMYYLPVATSGSGLFYNKKLFEQNGWNEDPRTWSEFVKLLEAIKAKGVIPITYPGVYPHYTYAAFGDAKSFEIAEQKGTLQTFEDNYRNFKFPQYSAPEKLEVWNRVYELGKKGFFPDGVAALNHTQSQMQVLQGKAAMVSVGVYVENEMKESTPPGFEWGFMAVPMSEKPDSTIWIKSTSNNGNQLIWAAKPELNKKWAKQFIVWLWNMDNQKIIAEKGGQLPIRKDYMENKANLDKLQSAMKSYLQYIQTHNTHLESEVRDVTLTDPAKDQAEKVFREGITDITAGKVEPKTILDKADEYMKKAIDAQK